VTEELSAYQKGRCDGLLEYRLEIARLREQLRIAEVERDHRKARAEAAEAVVAKMVGELEHTRFIPNDSEAAAALSGTIERALEVAANSRSGSEIQPKEAPRD